MMTRTSWLVLGALLAGCEVAEDTDKDTTETDTDTPAEADPMGMARIVHASPDAPGVDLYIAGQTDPFKTNLAYGEATGYVDIPEGTITVEIRATGSAADSAPAFEAELSVMADTKYTVVAAGLLGSTDNDDKFRVLPFVEDFAAPDDGNAVVRIVHASPDAPAVAIDVGNDGTPEIAADDFGRFDETGTAGVALPAGESLAIGIWAGDPLGRVTQFTTPALPDGGELFLVATGLVGQQPARSDAFGILAIGEDGVLGMIEQDPIVYALHASPDAPAVDIFAGDAELISDLDFRELSAPIQVPPNTYTLDFFGTANGTMRPAGDPATSQNTPQLQAGNTYLVTASGYLAGGSPAFQLIATPDAFDGEDDALIKVVHASPDAPIVDVGTNNAGTLTPITTFAGLDFGDSSSPVGLDAGMYDLGIGGTGTNSTLFAFSGVELGVGDNLFFVATGETTDDFGLVIVDASETPWMAIGPALPDAD